MYDSLMHAFSLTICANLDIKRPGSLTSSCSHEILINPMLSSVITICEICFSAMKLIQKLFITQTIFTQHRKRWLYRMYNDHKIKIINRLSQEGGQLTLSGDAQFARVFGVHLYHHELWDK